MISTDNCASSYPKHVWSPSGGWYAQPANWKANTAIMGLFAFGLCAITWTISARLEQRPRMPEPDKFYPSRKFVLDSTNKSQILIVFSWSKQIIEHERQRKAEGGV